MENTKEMLVFNVLGQEINFKPQESSQDIAPEDVVGLVNKEAEEIAKKLPHLDSHQVAILAALKLAQDNLRNDRAMRNELDKIKSSAKEALSFIDEVTPDLN